MNDSVCLSIRLSITSFWLCSPHHIIMIFSELITIDRSHIHEKGQGPRSKVKVAEVKTQFCSFRTVTPVWIQMCQWNDAQSLMWHRRYPIIFQGHPSKFKAIRDKKIANFDLNWAFTDCNPSLNWPMAIYQISRSQGTKNCQFCPQLHVSGL